MLIGGDLIWWWCCHSSSTSWYDQDKTITTQGSIICEACDNFSKYLVSLMELRPAQLQAVKTFCYCGFDLSVVCPLQSIIDKQIAEIWEALRLRLPTCQMESWDRPNFSFYFARPKKYGLVGCFHVDIGAEILTISSSLKRALIWNNMSTVNIFGLCPLPNLICRFKVSIESFRFRKKVHNL